ncbi:transcriptional repressor, HgtR-related protein [Citrifermentans bemidjiense Bem]|uniref:Transcriptional repressor, HgtR-related protein n=1 Tax=Citrifermentans bemidjiense (strain ATCC BAA-1014 / DSM 16622 / JCM 12645 / Bem) TaxID=404380 RepID=B5EIY5_CITBB|nr:ribbon-helix-helix protein, CopG family [Citrifermentans bemidjiense]ACH39940.1 transcriptional repressor, HgtR-related protein [Citrifermentans bemidjiense Bem]
MHDESSKYAETAERKMPGAKRKSPRKKVNQVLKNVVSLRVSDQEKDLLERLTESTSQNVSDLVREAIGFWLAKRQGQRAAKTFRHTLQTNP